MVVYKKEVLLFKDGWGCWGGNVVMLFLRLVGRRLLFDVLLEWFFKLVVCC